MTIRTVAGSVFAELNNANTNAIVMKKPSVLTEN